MNGIYLWKHTFSFLYFCTLKLFEGLSTCNLCASHVLFQIAYLENLLKVYNEEIRRLQERELSVDDLEKEDSSYIQEHKLKRKVSLFLLVL